MEENERSSREDDVKHNVTDNIFDKRVETKANKKKTQKLITQFDVKSPMSGGIVCSVERNFVI